MTRLAARLGALLRAAPGQPSLVDTASLAMFSLVGSPPLVWPVPSGTLDPAPEPDASQAASGTVPAAPPLVSAVRGS